MTDYLKKLNSSSSSHRQKRRRYPGTQEIDRVPIHYADTSIADVNQDALPDPERLCDMELAYREQPFPEGNIILDGRELIASAFLALVVGALVLLLLGPVVPLMATLTGSGVVVFILLMRIWSGLTPLRLVLSVLLPPMTAILAHAMASLLAWRTASAILFGLIGLGVMTVFISHPVEFFRDWILTHPRLFPKERRKRSLPLEEVKNSALLMFLIAAVIAILVSQFNNTLGILAVVVMGLLTTQQFHLDSRTEQTGYHFLLHLQYAGRLVAHYLFYGMYSSGAAGVWIPQSSPIKRMLILLTLFTPPVLMLTSATSGFSVWDAPYIRAEFVDTFRTAMTKTETAESLIRWNPDLDWDEFFRPQVEKLDLTQYVNVPEEELPESIPMHRTDDAFYLDALQSSSSRWLQIVWIGLFSGKTWMLWIPLLSVVLGLLTTVLFFLACARPLLAVCWKFEDDLTNSLLGDARRRPIWQCFVDRIRSSPHRVKAEAGDPIAEADHVFFGISTVADYPVLLHKPLFAEHCYIVGQTGSGKTSLGIMPLLIQLMRGSAPPPPDEPDSEDSGQAEPKSTEQDAAGSTKAKTERSDAKVVQKSSDDLVPMVILDLKGDPSLFHTIRTEAAARGQEFRFFTPERGIATHVFNPFANFSTQNRSLLQVCQLMLDALGLNHGEGYGRSYFTRQNREALFDALNTDPAPQTFKELSDVLKSFRGRPNYPDIFELVSTIHALTQYPQLETIEPVSNPDSSIHMPTVLERRQVVYFWLPAAVESITVREIGKLALFSLLSAAIDRQRSGLDTRQTWLFIDEFQRLAGENFRIVLEQARSYGLGCIMANQTQADLKLPDMDLRPTVRTNTRVRMHFGVTDISEIQELCTVSGQEIAILESQGYTMSSKGVSRDSTTWNESLKERFLPADVLGATDHPRRCILHVTRGSGYSQFGGLPTIVDCLHPISRKLFLKRSALPWPTLDSAPGTTTSETDVSEIERQRNQMLVQDQEEALKGLFEIADSRFRSADQK